MSAVRTRNEMKMLDLKERIGFLKSKINLTADEKTRLICLEKSMKMLKTSIDQKLTWKAPEEKDAKDGME